MSSDYNDPSTWRLSTPNGIKYRWVSSSGSFQPEGASAEGEYLIQATDLQAFVVEGFPPPRIFGNTVFYPSGPVFPGTVLYVKNISWESHIPGLPVDPFSQDTSAPAGTYHPILKVSVSYGMQKEQKSQTDPNNPKTFMRVTGRAAGEYIHAEQPKAKWTTAIAGGPEADKESVKAKDLPSVIIVPETEWTVTWERIPRTMFDTKLIDKMRNKVGLINSSSIPLLHDAPLETIMFVGYDFEEQYTWRTLSQPPVKLDLKFLEKRVTDADNKRRGHNAFYRPGKGWQRLLFDGENPPFKTTDMNEIWES